MIPSDILLDIYHRLFARYGPQHWWPAEEPFEVIVGAILTQSTAWANVEKAIAGLKEARALSAASLLALPTGEIARLIHPSGFYNAKARKLKAFVEALRDGYGGDLGPLFALDAPALRRRLLSINGIGEETADSIILYATGKPAFVVDAYTRRIFQRLGLTSEKDYAEVQAFFIRGLPEDTGLFNEYHALLVRHGKEACRKRPACGECCLSELCALRQSLSSSEPRKTTGFRSTAPGGCCCSG